MSADLGDGELPAAKTPPAVPFSIGFVDGTSVTVTLPSAVSAGALVTAALAGKGVVAGVADARIFQLWIVGGGTQWAVPDHACALGFLARWPQFVLAHRRAADEDAAIAAAAAAVATDGIAEEGDDDGGGADGSDGEQQPAEQPTQAQQQPAQQQQAAAATRPPSSTSSPRGGGPSQQQLALQQQLMQQRKRQPSLSAPGSPAVSGGAARAGYGGAGGGGGAAGLLRVFGLDTAETEAFRPTLEVRLRLLRRVRSERNTKDRAAVALMYRETLATVTGPDVGVPMTRATAVDLGGLVLQHGAGDCVASSFSKGWLRKHPAADRLVPRRMRAGMKNARWEEALVASYATRTGAGPDVCELLYLSLARRLDMASARFFDVEFGSAADKAAFFHLRKSPSAAAVLAVEAAGITLFPAEDAGDAADSDGGNSGGSGGGSGGGGGGGDDAQARRVYRLCGMDVSGVNDGALRCWHASPVDWQLTLGVSRRRPRAEDPGREPIIEVALTARYADQIARLLDLCVADRCAQLRAITRDIAAELDSVSAEHEAGGGGDDGNMTG